MRMLSSGFFRPRPSWATTGRRVPRATVWTVAVSLGWIERRVHSAGSREGSGECLGGDIVGQRSVANGQADAVDKSQEQSVIAGAEFERHILQNDRSSESGQGGKNLFGGYNID
jgi:hypothetical protein